MDPIFYEDLNISQLLFHVQQNNGTIPEEFLEHARKLQQRLFDHQLHENADFRLHKALLLYVPPVLLVLGFIGNVLSFFILRHKTMTRQSTTLFLAVLSIADSLVLLVGLLRKWVGEISGIDIQSESMALCKLITVFAYCISHYSVWLIVAVTIERYIVVCRPLQAPRYCKQTRARKVVLLMVIVFFVCNIHFLWTVELTEKQQDGKIVVMCEAAPMFVTFIDRIWPWIDLVLYSLVPLVILLFFNTIIIKQVVKATVGRDILQNGPLMKVDNRRSSKGANIKLTIMLLTISFTFLATTVPMNVVMIFTVMWNKNEDPDQFAKLLLIRTISELLMYLNHSINFFLYCATGQKFRTIVVRMICGRSTSNISNLSDHSQHLYCSRGNNNNCKGHKSEKYEDETAL